MIPHGLNLELKYQIENIENKINISKVEGYIELGNGKTKVVIPMRSFVANFLRILHSHFNKTSTYSKIKTAIALSASDTYGIKIGRDFQEVSPNDNELVDEYANASITHSVVTNSLTPQVVGNECKFTVSRTFTNMSSVDNRDMNEMGITVKNMDTTASKYMIIRDLPIESLNPDEVKTVNYSLQVTHDSSTGGFVLNFIKFIYNLVFNGSATASPMLKSDSTNFASVYATNATALTDPQFAVTSAIVDNFGIVVGYDERATSPNSTNMTMVTSNITKGTTDISNISINGSDTYFTISREFTNTGTTPVTLNRIGILTKSLIYLAINNTGSNIVLQPNQKLKVTYTLSTTC